MLTRCPECSTTFRVTAEQLKMRAGTVRCGKCQAVFNALDSLLESATPEETLAPQSPAPTDTLSASSDRSVSIPSRPQIADVDILLESPTATEESPPPDPPVDRPPTPAPVVAENIVAETTTPSVAPEEPPASAESIRDAGLAEGLIAARETTQIPGYNKWAQGALAGQHSVSEPATRPLWPFVLTALLLLLLLLGQVGHRFRAELAVATPSLRPLLEAACAALDCDIPLPRHVELVSIEASDLQIDPNQGGALTLTATLKNRAAYAQAWPLLELTLTDVQDNAVLRRVLQPADYLPPKADPTVFPPNGEVGLRLWLEVKDITAAGYRLYVFYP
ncbi:MAG: DUF3426 domain-containing protein [Zoogloeaceae bacterium]|nr:DUF3426 domain-containing protein [Zoogloeaceae bacterium]